MPGITRRQIDAAGGSLIGGSSDVFVNGYGVSRLGDVVAGHGLPPHSSPVMAAASSTVFVNGRGVCRAGDAASCGDSATGSSNVSAG